MSLLHNYLPSFSWSGFWNTPKDQREVRDREVKDPVGYGILAGMLIGSFFSTFTIFLVLLGVILLSRPEMQTFIDLQVERLLHSDWVHRNLDNIGLSLFGSSKDSTKKRE